MTDDPRDEMKKANGPATRKVAHASRRPIRAKGNSPTPAHEPSEDSDADDDGHLDRCDNRNPLVVAIASIYVEHPRFAKILARIRMTVDTLHGCDAEPPCLCVGGPSGVGKTTLLRKLQAAYPKTTDGVRVDHPLLGKLVFDHVPVLIVRISSSPSVTSLGRAILKAFGDPNHYRGDKDSIATRIELLIKGCGTKAIVIDEAQRIADRSGTQIAFEIIDWLRDRSADTGAILILVGLGRMLEVIAQDEQFERRYDAEIRLLPYRWKDSKEQDLTEDQEDFCGIMAAVAKLSPAKFAVDVDVDHADDAIATLANRRLHYASRGLFGHLSHLLKHAVQIVSENRDTHPEISLAVLHAAFETGFNYRRKGMENPFAEGWSPKLPPPVEDDKLFKSPAARRRAKKLTQRERREQVVSALSKR